MVSNKVLSSLSCLGKILDLNYGFKFSWRKILDLGKEMWCSLQTSASCKLPLTPAVVSWNLPSL